MPNDKCPFCGADLDQDHANPHYLCESGDEGHGVEQSDLCRTRCELAALRTRHQRLVEAARKVVDEDHNNRRFHSGCGHACPLNDQIVDLKQALESEANNE